MKINRQRTILKNCLYRIRHFLPDSLYIKVLYKLEMGIYPNLRNPCLFTEKIQWLKLYNRKDEYTMMVDKYEVKHYVSSIIGEKYIIPTIGVWDNFEEIDFNTLPNQFVLKTTQGSHASIICRDKKNFDIEAARLFFKHNQYKSPYNLYKEWAYKNVKPRIIAEIYMESPGQSDLIDYKFFCFNGKALYCQVIKDRTEDETIDFFDRNWIHQEFIGLNPNVHNSITPIQRPKKYDEMLTIADKLSQQIPFVRIDLYDINDEIYFGEITFYPAAGFGQFKPQEWDKRLGYLINLPQKKKA